MVTNKRSGLKSVGVDYTKSIPSYVNLAEKNTTSKFLSVNKTETKTSKRFIITTLICV